MTLMFCRNGLHEIDPDDPWRHKDGSRCLPCFRKKRQRAGKAKTLNGNGAATAARNWIKITEERRKRRNARRRNNPRERAGLLCRKYGVPLKFYDDLGWYPPDVQEALSGSS